MLDLLWEQEMPWKEREASRYCSYGDLVRSSGRRLQVELYNQANLRKRIEDIMTNRIAARISLAKKAVLAAGGIAALGLPSLA